MTGPPGRLVGPGFIIFLSFSLHCWSPNYTQNHFGICVCAQISTGMHVCDSGTKQGIKYTN